MSRDPFVFIFTTDHKAGDILQENQWGTALRAKFDKMRALLRGLGKEHAIIGDNPHRTAHHMGKASDQGFAKTGFEFVKPRAVNQARDHLADVIGGAQIGGHDADNLGGVIGGIFGAFPCHGRRFGAVQMADRAARQGQSVSIIFGQVVRDA